jgi:hypothetical protein
MRAIDADPRHEFAGSMHWLVSDCYEKLKRDGAVSVEEADPVIEWGYQTLFDRYQRKNRQGPSRPCEGENASGIPGRSCSGSGNITSAQNITAWDESPIAYFRVAAIMNPLSEFFR